MKKPKFIEDEARQQYLKNLNDLNQKINPKPCETKRNMIIQQLKKERGM